MDSTDRETEALVQRASQGDENARQELLARFRERLRHMVAARMDRRLRTRLDPSDVVQEALADAFQKLADYLRQRPLPFYPWLRDLAWRRLIDLHRRHLLAQKRSVKQEEGQSPGLPDESVLELAERLMDAGSSPSTPLLRDELRQQVHRALSQLPERDR